jgi:solute carrier family 50 protein (sugar transporter)
VTPSSLETNKSHLFSASYYGSSTVDKQLMPSTTDAPEWASFCGQLAPIFSILVFAAPIPTIVQIQRDKSVGSLPLLPYSSMLSSAFLWVVYGFLKSEPKIWIANGTGLILSIFYVVGFCRYCQKASPTLPGTVQQHLQACAATIGMTALIAISLPNQTAAPVIGNAGVVLCILMFASPLAALKTVFETSSAKSIPLPFTIAAVMNCFLWSVTGIYLMDDPVIYAPNLLGLSFGLVQVALKLYFGNNPKKDTGSESDHEEPLLSRV